MKKTHSANIGGTVFQVEEDAYEQLQAYLQSIEAHFRSYPDVADIVSDIEGRIAEQLLLREQAPQVVRISDVERVIAAMGHIEQFDEPQAAPAEPAGQIRRLFRDPDHRIIAGVAAGLASYLGAPLLLVRALFVLLTVFFGTGVVLYLLLWALLPVATSTTDKLQMRGRPLTLAAIDQGVRDGIASIPAKTRNFAVQGVMAAGSLVHLVVVSIARALKWAAGVFIVGSAVVGVLILTVLLVLALVNPAAAPLGPVVAAFFDSFGAWQHLLKAFFYLIAVIPLALVVTTAFRLFWNVNRLNTRGLASLLGVWVVSLLTTTAIWASNYPELRRFQQEYPAAEAAERRLDTFRALFETSSPLTDEQAGALRATLVAEHKRRAVMDRAYRAYQYHPSARIEQDEQGNQRIVESAKSYLKAEQLQLMQDYMAQNITRAQADLREWQQRSERGWR